jgi:hypothetical protein
MKTLHVQTQSGPDRVLHLDIPVEASNALYDVVVVIQPKANDAEPANLDERGWPAGFFEATAGSIQDPTFRRHEQGEFEKRLEL